MLLLRHMTFTHYYSLDLGIDIAFDINLILAWSSGVGKYLVTIWFHNKHKMTPNITRHDEMKHADDKCWTCTKMCDEINYISLV